MQVFVEYFINLFVNANIREVTRRANVSEQVRKKSLINAHNVYLNAQLKYVIAKLQFLLK